MFKTTPLLGQPITHFNKKLIDDKSIFDNVEYDEPKKDGGTMLSKEHFLLDSNKKFKHIKDILVEHVEKYKTDILGIKSGIVMTNSWLTLNKPGCKMYHHSHPNAFLSLTHYINCDGGDLRFQFEKSAITQYYDIQFDILEYNLFNSHSWTFNVKTDDTYIFPAAIHHNTLPNESKTDRIMLGANFFFKGVYGTHMGLDMINFK